MNQFRLLPFSLILIEFFFYVKAMKMMENISDGCKCMIKEFTEMVILQNKKSWGLVYSQRRWFMLNILFYAWLHISYIKYRMKRKSFSCLHPVNFFCVNPVRRKFFHFVAFWSSLTLNSIHFSCLIRFYFYLCWKFFYDIFICSLLFWDFLSFFLRGK